MEMQNRISYNAQELIRNTERVLDELKMFQYEPRYRALLGDSLLEKLALWDRNIRARKDDPFTLVVCGEFKRGKSSLINALLGEEVVTTNVTTETVTLNRIRYGAHANEAILSGGRRMSLSDEELRKDRLEELIRQSPEPITQLELRRPIEFLKNVTIVDTPGLNDSLKDFSDLVEVALQQADAVIYVCSVNSPLSMDEQIFLRTMILPQRYTDLFVVANYSDMLRGADVERFQQFMDQRVASLLPGQQVMLLSALDELCRILGEERPNEKLEDMLAENFGGFRRKLDELVQAKKDILLPDRICRMVQGMENAMDEEMAALSAGLELDARKAAERAEAAAAAQAAREEEQARVSGELKAEVSAMELQTGEWMGGLLSAMCGEVDTLTDVSADDLTKFYSIYCVDTIQNALNRCVEYHMEQLYDRLDAVSLQAAKGFYQSEGAGNYGFRFDLANKTWTMGDNVGYVASKLSQLGLISLVVDGVAGAMRQKETADRVPTILQAIKRQYPGFRASAEEAVADTYARLAAKVGAQLSEYYNDQAEKEKTLTEQTVRVARQSEERKEEIRAAMDQLRQMLAGLRISD